MKINAKKTNSASENAIQSSYFGLELKEPNLNAIIQVIELAKSSGSDQSYHRTNRVPVGQLKSTHIVLACVAGGIVSVRD